MESVESQIAEWRAYVAEAPGVNGRDVDELEDHLRHQIAELSAAGLAADEAFLVAVKRMGDLDDLSREFAREHSGRLWKQLVLGSEDETERAAGGWLEPLVFALAAAVAVQIAARAAGFPDEEPSWLARNITLFVLPFLAAYFARRRQLDTRQWVLTAAPFVLAALVINLYPWEADSATEELAALHLPVVLWFAVAYPYMGGTIRSHERRMDFVRFTGEWFIYYVLIALGGGVLMGLTAGDPRAHGGRRRADRRMGAALGSGRWRHRGCMARRVEATGRREHGAGAHDALHASVRPDAGRRRRRLRRDRARRCVRSRAPQRLRRSAGRRPRTRPVRDVCTRPVDVAELDGPHPAGRCRQRSRARPDGARLDDRSNRRPRVHAEPNGSARPQPRPPRESGRGRLAIRPIPQSDAAGFTGSNAGRPPTFPSSPCGPPRSWSSFRHCSPSTNRIRIGLSAPLSSRARGSLPLRRGSTPSAQNRSATWRLRRGSPRR